MMLTSNHDIDPGSQCERFNHEIDTSRARAHSGVNEYRLRSDIKRIARRPVKKGNQEGELEVSSPPHDPNTSMLSKGTLPCKISNTFIRDTFEQAPRGVSTGFENLQDFDSSSSTNVPAEPVKMLMSGFGLFPLAEAWARQAISGNEEIQRQGGRMSFAGDRNSIGE
jgi:hypothetical protein